MLEIITFLDSECLKAFKSSKKPSAQIFCVLCISKIVSGKNWEQALNESGVNLHSVGSLFITKN